MNDEHCRWMHDTGEPFRPGCEATRVWCRHPTCPAGRADVHRRSDMCTPKRCRYFEAGAPPTDLPDCPVCDELNREVRVSSPTVRGRSNESVRGADAHPEHPQLISVCINSADEGMRLRQTIREVAIVENGEVEIIVVLDGTDGRPDMRGCMRFISNPEPVGCGKAKRQATAAATGDVLIFMDAHMTVEQGSLAALAHLARETNGIVCPALQNIRYDDDWKPHPKDQKPFVPSDAHFHYPPNKKQYRFLKDSERGKRLIPSKVAGCGLAVQKDVLERMGGWTDFIGRHGAQELAMSLRAFQAKVPVHIAPQVVLGHEFRKHFPYKAPTMRDAIRNAWQAGFVHVEPETWEKYLKPLLDGLKHSVMGEGVTRHPDVLAERNRFLRDHKRRDDKELLQLWGLSGPPKPHIHPEAVPMDYEARGDEIDVRIPYRADGDLGFEYNRLMGQSDGWVLLLDHDVLLLNPHWYELCQQAIEEVGEDAGIITCRTNNIACPGQKDKHAPGNADLDAHRKRAVELWKAHGAHTTDITRGKKLIGGFFMLVHRKVWERVGGFKRGFLGVDNNFHQRVMRAGLKVYRLDGLYCYHNRHEGQRKEWTEEVRIIDPNYSKRHNPNASAGLQADSEEVRIIDPNYSERPQTPKNTRVVYTVITDGYDELRAPSAPCPGWDFVCFTDDPAKLGDVPAPWQVRTFAPPDAAGHAGPTPPPERMQDPRYTSRAPKMLPHRYLPEYRYSVHIDGNMQLHHNPSEMCERAGWPMFATVRHPYRDCVYKEAHICALLGKGFKDDFRGQIQRYRDMGQPEHTGLWESGFLLREHNQAWAKELGEAWWAEFCASSHRDQLAFAHVCWRTGKRPQNISATERSRFISIQKHNGNAANAADARPRPSPPPPARARHVRCPTT